MIRLLCLAALLTGCASSPYMETRAGYQVDAWSDWTLQPEREWIFIDDVRFDLTVGLEWKGGIDCPFVSVTMAGPYEQGFIGCSKRFGSKWFVQPAIVHQMDSRSSPFIRTDQKQWQGHNPFLHLRAGYDWGPAQCPQIATGKSLLQGAPVELDQGEPDIYWTQIECSVRFWGRSGFGAR